MKLVFAALLAAAALAGCRDSIAPFAPIHPIAGVDALPLSIATGSATYNIVDLGFVGDAPSTEATAINEAGQIIGFARPSFEEHRAFLWSGGVMTNLPSLGGTFTFAAALNDLGDVVGSSYLPGNAGVHAVLWVGGTATDLGILPGDIFSEAVDVNNNSVVVGRSCNSIGCRVFLWQHGVMSALPRLGGNHAIPKAINDNGDVVGYSHVAGNQSQHAVLWRNGAAIDLGTLGGANSSAMDVNAAGQVTGFSEDAAGGRLAFRWENGVITPLPGAGGAGFAINASGDIAGSVGMDTAFPRATLWRGATATDLGTLGSGWSWGYDVNDAGQVTGYSGVVIGPAINSHAFLWENGTMYDMGDLGGGVSFPALGNSAINNRGQIVGWSQRPNFEGIRATLWDPVPTSVLSSLGDAKLWIGLKNSDAVGLRVDLRAEVLVNGVVVGSAELNNQTTGSSGFNNAQLKTLDLALANSVTLPSGAAITLRPSVRRTCFGAGHNSGSVRFWYNGQPVDQGASRDAGSRFDATIGGASSTYFARTASALSSTAGTARTFVDVAVNSSAACPSRPYNVVGFMELELAMMTDCK